MRAIRDDVRAIRSVQFDAIEFSAGIPPAARFGVVVGLVIATLGAAISMAPWEVAESGLALSAIFVLLWRNSDPPVLLLPPLFQWTEVAIVPISTIWNRQPLNALSPSGANLEAAALFGLLGIVCLAFGLRIAMGRPVGVNRQLRNEVSLMPFEITFRVAISLMVSGYLVIALSPFAGPSRELLHNVGGIKYVGFFILSYWCLVRRERMAILALVVTFEVISGLTGFFANFKESLLVLILAALSARSRLRANDAIVISLVTALLLTVAIFWSAVKPSYRSFVNEGSGAQVVLVPLADRIEFLAGEAASFDLEKVSKGFDALVDRHGYIEFLARTMEYIPRSVPHENGALTLAVLQHVSIPRFLDPSKPPLPDDTEVMAKYTGQINTWDKNTSISLGYLAELYVDLGYFGALVGTTAIGIILGSIYRFLSSSRQTPAIVTVGLTIMAALPVAYFGLAYVKLVGAMISSSAVSIAFQRFGRQLFEGRHIERERARR